MISHSKTRNEMLRDVMEADFAAYDLQLYLDTHPDDKNALSMYTDVVKRGEAAKKAFESAYGPLTPDAAAGKKEWTWIRSPWPWE